MRVLKTCPIPGQMPTQGLVKVLGPLAETSNLSTPRQGESTLQRNPYEMRQTTDFYLIKNFCCSQPPSSHPHSKSGLLFRSKTVRQSSSKRGCVQGEPFPVQPWNAFLQKQHKPAHTLPIPLLHPNCEGRRENCRNTMFIHHRPRPPLKLGEGHLMKTVYL